MMASLVDFHIEGNSEGENKLICANCIGEKHLSKDVAKSGKHSICDYCQGSAPTWSIQDLAERIDKAFSQHYARTSDQPEGWEASLMADRESSYEWSRGGLRIVDAIEGAARIPTDAAQDVQEILEEKYSDFDSDAAGMETDFSADSHYEIQSADSGAWQYEWRWFERMLRSEARFFSREASAHLGSVFGGIDRLRTRSGRRLIANAGPGRKLNHLFRARVFQADAALEKALERPDFQLGSPPGKLAHAGRMNARGISVFYGSTLVDTAIAKVRPPVGSKVAVAKFEIIRPLRLLDLSIIDQVIENGSIFDPTLRKRQERVAFLRTLGERLTRAVMPDDEALEYLTTQAIADFLATENDPVFDGIIFHSAQANSGRNVVLFYKSARVEELELPQDTEITVSSYHNTEDGPEIDYWVFEQIPPENKIPASDKDDRDFSFLLIDLVASENKDVRHAALRVDTKSVQVHWIDWVKYRSTSHEVRRHRSEKRSPKF